VLFVDDSAVVRATTGKLLSARGMDVRVCATVAEARALDATLVDAALLDLEIGEDSGADLASELRARAPRLPIAFLTATLAGPLYEAARALGPVFDKAATDEALGWLEAIKPGRGSA
jgi:CheY-like chemotaxis protein